MPHPSRPLAVVAHPDAGRRAELTAGVLAADLGVLDCAERSEAITLAVAEQPDVLILPAGEGVPDLTAAVGLLQADERLSRIPIVVACSDPAAPDVAGALALGAVDVLRLPASRAEVEARAGAALRIGRLHEEVRQRAAELVAVSRIDPLTGLSSRRHVEEHLVALAAAARRQRRRMSVAVVDIDHLRRINEDRGRHVGDAVLREVARRTAAVLRTEDQAGRWGGEELLLVLPTTELAGAWTVAERLRRAVEEAPVSVPGGEVLVTISAGCADGDGSDADRMLHRAEAALHAAKAAGRNRVMTDPTGGV